MLSRTVRLLTFWTVLAMLMSGTVRTAAAMEWFVAPGGIGNGTIGAPFGQIQAALDRAQPGDTITLQPGSYSESLHTVRNGTATARILLRSAQGLGSVLVTVRSTILRVDHAYLTVDGVILDGQYAADDLIDVNDGGDVFTLRNSEVRRTSRDCIDMASPTDVLIDRSLIHHALNAAGGRTDAHGIVAGAVRNLTIRDTEIHTFSGDAFQVDPVRRAPGWDNVTIERCRLWLAPLAQAENGFAAGTVTGENAVDTKTRPSAPRARITVRDSLIWGFQGGLIGNMSAFNLKEGIDATIDRVTVWNSEIAFRLRGPTSSAPAGAWVKVQNTIIHNVARAIRYENHLENLRLWNTTFGRNITKAFEEASSGGSVFDVRNLLVLGAIVPPRAAGPGNLAVTGSAFVNAIADDYHLASLSPAVNAGVVVAGVLTDRDGLARPQGPRYDAGAYELP